MSGKMYWHFAAINYAGQPVMRDGTLIEVGEKYTAEKTVLCEQGYHGSLRAIDALNYAPGPWVSLRPLRYVKHGEDKAVGRSFVQQPGVDASQALREFARWCALQVIDLWDHPPVVRQYLETGDDVLRAAARDAVWAAAGDAAGAAGAAAWAARYAARDAVWAAAGDAARAAAWAAAVWDARAAQNEKLEALLRAALQEVEE